MSLIPTDGLSPTHGTLEGDWKSLPTSRHICFALIAFGLDPWSLWQGEPHADMLMAAMTAEAAHLRLKALRRPRTRRADPDDLSTDAASYVDPEVVPIFKRGRRRRVDGVLSPTFIEAHHLRLTPDAEEQRFLDAVTKAR